jgi:hypothetical protein
MRIDVDTCRDPDLLASEVRRLRAVITAGDCPDPDNAAKPATLTDAEREAISEAACICEDAGRTDIAIIINKALSRPGLPRLD